MPERYSRILDVGIGFGGSYIQRDSPSVLRVGMDLERGSINQTSRFFDIPCVRANAAVESGEYFPFADGSFDRAQFIFPHGTLLRALTSEIDIWSELNRILKPSGKVEVVLEAPDSGIQLNVIGGQESLIYEPEERVQSMAQLANFTADIDILEKDDIIEYGTIMSAQATFSFWLNVFRIEAIKRW